MRNKYYRENILIVQIFFEIFVEISVLELPELKRVILQNDSLYGCVKVFWQKYTEKFSNVYHQTNKNKSSRPTIRAFELQHTMIWEVSEAVGWKLAEEEQGFRPSRGWFCFDLNTSNHYIDNLYYHYFITKWMIKFVPVPSAVYWTVGICCFTVEHYNL